MSTLQNNQTPWSNIPGQQLDSKYEKCRNITEEIYKRINITFQIKKLETGDQSDVSDNSEQIDSNELSNETDLFACDKSDISSSTEAERPPQPTPLNYININNNEEKNKPAVYKKPRKRFRKRVKKRPPNRKASDTEGSSDEAPLARSVLILPTDLKQKPQLQDKKAPKKDLQTKEVLLTPEIKFPSIGIKIPTVVIQKKDIIKTKESIDKTTDKKAIDKKSIDKTVDKDGKDCSSSEKKNKDKGNTDKKSCNLCSLSFRGERGLRVKLGRKQQRTVVVGVH